MNKTRLKALREMLLARRREILKQHLTNGEATAPVEVSTGDAADAASENDVKEMALNLLESEKRALEGIESALTRIDEGTYGVCEECEQPIPEKRLLVLPQARLCVSCQEKQERGR